MAETTHTIGRRKEAVCRVYITPGSGKWDVNGRTIGDYFPRPAHVFAIQQAFQATDTLGNYDVKLDWFYLDYHFSDAFGIRAGRTKLPFGLYNEFADVDA